jgi:hypothetical protein
MLARKIVSIHPGIVLIAWIGLALTPSILVTVLDASTVMLAMNVSTLIIGACWCGWMWAIRTAALEETPGDATPRRPWLHAAPILAFLPFMLLPEGALDMGGLAGAAINLAAVLLFGSTVFCLWKTAEALERMVAAGEAPPKTKIFNTTVLLAMIYIAPFVVARRFAVRAKLEDAVAA